MSGTGRAPSPRLALRFNGVLGRRIDGTGKLPPGLAGLFVFELLVPDWNRPAANQTALYKRVVYDVVL